MKKTSQTPGGIFANRTPDKGLHSECGRTQTVPNSKFSPLQRCEGGTHSTEIRLRFWTFLLSGASDTLSGDAGQWPQLPGSYQAAT